MDEFSGNQAKSTIDKSKLNDEDLDKLVIDTSHLVSSKYSLVTSSSSNDDDLMQKSQLEEETSCKSSDYNRLNQPKRPMNAFMVWGQAIRRELHLRYSNVQNAMLSKALGRVWRSLNVSEKELYVNRANLIKAKHKLDYPNYRYQPRRLQERRSRGNMLIGIHLNHPVTEHDYQVDMIKMGQVDRDTNYAISSLNNPISNETTGVDYSFGHNFSLVRDVGLRGKRNPDGARVFQYQPYSVQYNNSTESRLQLMHGCKNYPSTQVVCQNECYPMFHRELAAADKQVEEHCSYQSTYSMNQSLYAQPQQYVSNEMRQSYPVYCDTRSNSHYSSYYGQTSTLDSHTTIHNI